MELIQGRVVDPRFEVAAPVGGPVVNAYREGEPVAWAALTDRYERPDIEMVIRAGFEAQGIEEQLHGHMRWLAGIYSKATDA